MLKISSRGKASDMKNELAIYGKLAELRRNSPDLAGLRYLLEPHHLIADFNGSGAVIGPYYARTIHTEIAEKNAFSEEDCRQIAKKLLLALQVLHGAGLAHRDLKPANIALRAKTSKGELDPVLLDMGLCGYKAALAGTDAYYAPEQWRLLDPQKSKTEETPKARVEADPALLDLWNLGLVLLECGLGHHIVNRDNAKVVREEAAWASWATYRRRFAEAAGLLTPGWGEAAKTPEERDLMGLSPAFASFIDRLACERTDRFQTVEDALRDPWIATEAATPPDLVVLGLGPEVVTSRGPAPTGVTTRNRGRLSPGIALPPAMETARADPRGLDRWRRWNPLPIHHQRRLGRDARGRVVLDNDVLLSSLEARWWGGPRAQKRW